MRQSYPGEAAEEFPQFPQALCQSGLNSAAAEEAGFPQFPQFPQAIRQSGRGGRARP
jgi:hypothetical protein